MKLQFKKILSTILIAQILFFNTAPVAMAEEGTTVTATAETVTMETPTSAPEEATPAETTPPQETPAPASEVTPTEVQQQTESITPSPAENAAAETNINNDESKEDEEAREEAEERAKLEERRARSNAAAQEYLTEEGDANRTQSATSAFQTGVNLGGSVGTDSTINTGDSTITSAIVNTGNDNLAGNGAVIDETPGGAQVVTNGNGPSSDNNGALIIDNDSTTIQENTANVNTNITQSATTGSNSNSENVGANSTINTGDANSTGTVITAVNTNAAGIMISEFNIANDQIGDIILDFGAGCITGCAGGVANVENTGNGSSSSNGASIDETNNNQTFQKNDATIENELTLSADSGNNTANANTGGNSDITTGDANVAANALTFANNNIAGNVVFGVVNIFGDLIGDILLPEEAINNCCGTTDISVKNTDNGSLTDNNAAINIDNFDTIDQTNVAEINNNLIVDASTGDNSTSRNTGGDSTIKTGNTDVNASLINVVNNNLIGGNMWLVLINEAGNWVGKLLGAPDGSNMAASQGTELRVGSDGQVYATNSGNGTSSDNNADINQTNNNTTEQTNNAVINNTLDLSANTGGNTANSNTGGDSNIKTGDATIVANIVNFVNNNIVGNGKLVVTVVNVFGSWLGDFVAPGQHKQNKPEILAQNTTPPTIVPSTVPTNNTTNSPTPTPTNTTSTGQVAGLSQSAPTPTTILPPQANNPAAGSTSTSNTNVGASVSVKVAGISTINDGLSANNVTKTKGIKINLAWLVLILPVFGAFIAKKYVFKLLKK